MLAEVPMQDPKQQANLLRKDSNPDDGTVVDTWQWWNKFRTYADYSPKLKVSQSFCFNFTQSRQI